MPNEVASNDLVDFVLTGECELTLPRLLRAIGSGIVAPDELRKTGNIYFRHENVVISGESTDFLSSAELDALPYPAFDMMDMDSYFSRHQTHGLFSRGKRILPIITSRGCPYNCNFCCRMMGKEIRKRNADSVIAEIKFMIDRYGIDELYIEDDNFTFDKKRALYILNKITELPDKIHLKFANGIRIEHTDDEIFDAMRGAGAYSISFGIESGCERTLNAMGKKINLVSARQTILKAKSHGFLVGANCIIGYPGETVSDIRKSVDYFLSLPLDSMAIVNLIPFPGTETRHYCEKMGYLMPDSKNWDNYYFSINSPKKLIETPSLSYLNLCRETKRAYLKMYMRPSWIVKNVRNFKIEQIIRGIKFLLFGSR
jgi:magnesium-protoporphyrin IX monomethyl ester (oxidative) cyclase